MRYHLNAGDLSGFDGRLHLGNRCLFKAETDLFDAVLSHRVTFPVGVWPMKQRA